MRNSLQGWFFYGKTLAAAEKSSIELKRRHPHAVCVALHPGTVDTGLSTPFAKTGLDVRTPDAAAERLLTVIHHLQPEQSGGFINHDGTELPW